jgi:hypothetical protein
MRATRLAELKCIGLGGTVDAPGTGRGGSMQKESAQAQEDPTVDSTTIADPIRDLRWHYTTREMFLRVLVYDLVKHGAASTPELECRLRYNKIRLTAQEVLALVEWARRTGLIEPTGHPIRADGSPITQSEWTPTAAGRKLPPPLSEESANQGEFTTGALRRGFLVRVAPLIKFIGLTTLLAALAGVTKLPSAELVIYSIFLFSFLVIVMYTVVAPLRVRVMDWTVLTLWPRYQTISSSYEKELKQLKERRKCRSLFNLSYVGYWTYIALRAEIINSHADIVSKGA